MESSSVEVAGKAGEKFRAHAACGASYQCSVCLEAVILDAAQRSVAKLKCGHYFHLDCIGSAYNAKGIMQCPNCRDIEDGHWLYANGGGLPDDIPFEEMGYEDSDYDIYGGVSEFLLSHEHIGSMGWCPYPGVYSHFSVSLGGVEPSASGCPDLLVNVVCGNLPSSYPFVPSNESRSSTFHLGYDSMTGALQHLQSESLGAEAARLQGFTSPDAGQWSHHLLPMSNPMPLDDSVSSRLMPVQERSLSYRVPTDIGAQQRTIDASNASPIWAEPPAHGQFQSGRRPVPPSGSLQNVFGTSSSWRNRGHGGSGRTGQTSDSHAPLHWGVATPTGAQDPRRANMHDTNWQGDQGIPWRSDTFPGNPWVIREPEYMRWNSVGSSSSHASTHHGAHGLGNGAFRTPSAFSGYSSAFQHDGSGDVGSLHPHLNMRPR